MSYAGRFEETVGFKQANCSGKIQSAKKIGFWCAIESSGSVMMIGGGGQPCTLGDHGIGITSARRRSFNLMRHLLRETTLAMLQRHHPKLVIR